MLTSNPIGKIFADKALAFCAAQEHFVAVRYRCISDIRSPSWAFPPYTWAALWAASFFVYWSELFGGKVQRLAFRVDKSYELTRHNCQILLQFLKFRQALETPFVQIKPTVDFNLHRMNARFGVAVMFGNITTSIGPVTGNHIA